MKVADLVVDGDVVGALVDADLRPTRVRGEHSGGGPGERARDEERADDDAESLDSLVHLKSVRSML